MSLTIDDNLVVTMHYKLTDEAGELIDRSQENEPMSYLHGAQNIIPGLEKALVGKKTGDTVNAVVEPAEGYGDVNPEMIQKVPKSAFQGVEKVEPGMAFEAQGENGEIQRVVVAAVEGEEVTIDVNHPLAGKTLTFDVEIVSVREATAEEIEHNHVH